MATPNLNQTASALLAALYPVRIIDEQAETSQEIAARIGRSYSQTRAIVLTETRAGRIEQVWKRVGAQLVPAYRAVKKKAPAG